MTQSGHFEIRVGGVDAAEPVGPGGPIPDCRLRLEWRDGSPWITNLGQGEEVLVNSKGIDPHVPVQVRSGDTIAIGNMRLTWHTGPTPEEPREERTQVRVPSRPLPEPTEVRVSSQPHPEPAPVEATPTYRVTVQTPQGSKEISLTAEVLRIGRAADNEIRIEDTRVSRYHARLVRHAAGYKIVDLGSVNGLTIEKKRVSERSLVDGDVVWLAKGISLTYRVTRPATPKDELPAHPSEPAQGAVPDATVVVPKRSPDETVVKPRPAAKPPVREPDRDADATVVVPEKRAEPPQTPPADATVLASKRVPRKPRHIPLDEPAMADQGIVRLGSQTGGETERVDMAGLLKQGIKLQDETGTIIRNTKIPYLVVHLPNRTWEVQFTKERMSIGREADNDIPIVDPSISRLHAWIERQGSDFVIREAQSRNGIWLGKQRVDQHALRDGDILSLGRAKLVFKGGFTSDDLTLIGTPRIDGKPARRPVVIIPGLMGSELWLGSERLWPNPRQLISHPEVFSLPGDPRIEARGIVSDVVIVPGIIKQQQYSRLGDYLETGLGYSRGKDLLEFAYDWRQDVRLSAQRLAESIERWQVKGPITIIGHSLGTLVTRYYVEKLGGKRVVERIVLMGGPHYGSPKSLAALLVGPGLLPFGMGDERLRRVLAGFPSTYQILPVYPCVEDQEGHQINVLKDESWLPEPQRPFLRAARSFRRELGLVSSVPSVSIFGYGLETILHVKIHRAADGHWDKVDFIEDTAGDLSVPSGSAVLKKSEIHPVFQEHGSLYVDDDVKMRLKVELTRSTTWQRR
jgi:pSer/pThr/pTyr-binding forkhead associated (FHA) protein